MCQVAVVSHIRQDVKRTNKEHLGSATSRCQRAVPVVRGRPVPIRQPLSIMRKSHQREAQDGSQVVGRGDHCHPQTAYPSHLALTQDGPGEAGRFFEKSRDRLGDAETVVPSCCARHAGLRSTSPVSLRPAGPVRQRYLRSLVQDPGCKAREAGLRRRIAPKT